MMGYGMGYGMAGAMFLWWVILLGGVVLAGYGIAQLFRPKKDSSNDALERLKVRFAMGEISKEEYAERKQVLQG